LNDNLLLNSTKNNDIKPKIWTFGVLGFLYKPKNLGFSQLDSTALTPGVDQFFPSGVRKLVGQIRPHST